VALNSPAGLSGAGPGRMWQRIAAQECVAEKRPFLKPAVSENTPSSAAPQAQLPHQKPNSLIVTFPAELRPPAGALKECLNATLRATAKRGRHFYALSMFPHPREPAHGPSLRTNVINRCDRPGPSGAWPQVFAADGWDARRRRETPRSTRIDPATGPTPTSPQMRPTAQRLGPSIDWTGGASPCPPAIPADPWLFPQSRGGPA